MTRRDLRPIRLLMDAPLAARLPFEVLDRVRDVGLVAVDPCFHERLVEELSRRPDKRLAREVFLVAGLFADEDHLSSGRALSEDRLRPSLPERAGLAAGRGLAKLRQRRPWWDERRSASVELELAHGSGTTQIAAVPFRLAAPWPSG